MTYEDKTHRPDDISHEPHWENNSLGSSSPDPYTARQDSPYQNNNGGWPSANPSPIYSQNQPEPYWGNNRPPYAPQPNPFSRNKLPGGFPALSLEELEARHPRTPGKPRREPKDFFGLSIKDDVEKPSSGYQETAHDIVKGDNNSVKAESAISPTSGTDKVKSLSKDIPGLSNEVGKPLDKGIQDKFTQKFKTSADYLQPIEVVHNEKSEAVNEALGSKAVSAGKKIYMGKRGANDPRVLPYEVAHFHPKSIKEGSGLVKCWVKNDPAAKEAERKRREAEAERKRQAAIAKAAADKAAADKAAADKRKADKAAAGKRKADALAKQSKEDKTQEKNPYILTRRPPTDLSGLKEKFAQSNLDKQKQLGQQPKMSGTKEATRVGQDVGPSDRGYKPKPGERSMTKAEYKIQSSAKRNFPGKQTEMNCALQSGQQMIRASSGKNLTEAEMIASGKASANYDPKTGTMTNRIPDALKAEGVAARNMPNKPSNIQKALAQGKGVMSMHDAGKLWGDKSTGGHAVHVTSTVKDAKGKVTHYFINDTGTGVAGRKVTAAQYEGSLMNVQATVTDKPISYGGSAAEKERRKADKEQRKADQAAKAKEGSSPQSQKSDQTKEPSRTGQNNEDTSVGAKKKFSLSREGTSFIDTDPDVQKRMSDKKRQAKVDSDGQVIVQHGKKKGQTLSIQGAPQAGQIFTVDGISIKRDANGFPILNSKFDTFVPDSQLGTQKDGAHFKHSNERVREMLKNNPDLAAQMKLNSEQLEFFNKTKASSKSPPDLTWHHHQDTGRMQLINKAEHKAAYPHTGGMSIWGGGYKRKPKSTSNGGGNNAAVPAQNVSAVHNGGSQGGQESVVKINGENVKNPAAIHLNDAHAPAKIEVLPKTQGTQNSHSGRSGALIGGGMSAFQHLKNGQVTGQDVGDVALNSVIGGVSGKANDLLTPRLGGGFKGGLKAGGVLDAVTSAGFSTFANGDAYRQGKVTAGQATANVVVDTGVGVGAGMAGMAAGAAIGSVIPIAGTAVGAVIGFGAGMLGSWAASSLAENSGFTKWAKEGLGGTLNNYNKPLSKAWDGISNTTSAISGGVSDAWNALTSW